MIKLFCYLKPLMLFFVVFSSTITYSQNDTLVGPSKISSLIKAQEIEQAKTELYKQISNFKKIKDYDTLPYFVEFIGHKALSNNNWNIAVKNAENYVNELKTYKKPLISLRAIKNLSWIYSDAGKPELAYRACEEAFEFSNKLSKNKLDKQSELQYNLGYYASITGDFSLSQKHYKKSLLLLNKSKKENHEFYQQIYNALGGVMWNQAKMDSCLYYFEQSLNALKKTDSIPINLYYRPALLRMNLAIVENNLGKNSQAISYSKEAIANFQRFLETGKDEQKKRAAKRSQLAAIDNLGVFYNTIGQYNKAEELINYSYNIKKKDLEANDPNIIISKIILAQAKINTQDLQGAEHLLKSAIKSCEDNPERVIYWYMSANNTLAKVLNKQNNFIEAKTYAEIGEKYMRSYYKGNYNKDVLDELGSMALIYAENGYTEKALLLTKEVYTQIKNGDFKNTMQDLISTTSIAHVNYKLKKFKKAITYSNEVINFKLNDANKQAIDSVLIDYSKPLALLINAKSNYELLKNPTEDLLNQELVKIEKGIRLIEQRKAIITSQEDLTLLISQYKELFNFAKKIHLDLYNLTKKETHLNNIINLHESSIYNRIRSRLNLKNDIAFADLPTKIIEREKTLKQAMSKTLGNSKNIEDFFEAQNNWNIFRDSLKINYPKYYKMRYATIEEPLDSFQTKIPDNTTVIRYVFIENKLHAFIITKTNKNLYELDSENLKNNINALGENQNNISEMSRLYNKLYKQLWQPFETKIKTEHIIIFPDAELFNLSFETLTPTPLKSFSELASNSLLAKYNISYNYSLLLLDPDKNPIDYKNDFIAFAPEFNEQMKTNYKLAISDSITLDKTYLKLLPQPFSVDLAKEYSQLFKGTSFLNDKATKQVFTNEANEHKIIHIGTHAESNNISPELSRLIFAKNTDNDDNSLYTYEIYNQNLNSKLAILTACETGKPTYQSGEGMISLAHAFNYAGSESILTSLWKIDEKSSTKILQSFYKKLAEGLPKNQALKQAKLNYLATAQGRTIAPQYWAGLVLIGDTESIVLKTSSNSVYWLIGIIVLLILIILFKKIKTKKELLN